MSCQRAHEIDLAAFAAEPSAAEWQSFRSHYPTCEDCTGEVARWSKLGALLEAAAPGETGEGGFGHPSSEQLLAFRSAPAELAPDVRSRIEIHTRGCAPCRSELAVLRDFDMASVTTPRPVEAESGGFLRGLAAFIESLVGVAIPQPVLAGLVLVAIALPSAWLLLGGEGDPAKQLPPIAQQEEPPAAPSGPQLVDPTPPVEIAQEEPPPEPAPTAPATPSVPSAPPELIAELLYRNPVWSSAA